MNNDQQKAKELAELLTAFSEGKQLQYSIFKESNWRDYVSQSLREILADINSGCPIRIKPELNRVPLTQRNACAREYGERNQCDWLGDFILTAEIERQDYE